MVEAPPPDRALHPAIGRALKRYLAAAKMAAAASRHPAVAGVRRQYASFLRTRAANALAELTKDRTP